jgi:hypothetical protein
LLIETPDGLDAVDMGALRRAVAISRASHPVRASQVDSMLESRSWIEVARWCSYSCQIDALGLRPWQVPPAHIDPDDPSPGEEAKVMARLLARMLKAGISQFEPDPVTALTLKLE